MKILRPVPIILVVFDGLVATAIMDENREIDAIRYPNFARLAAHAHWFQHTTTVHPRTDHAVPAILSGRYPTDSTRPVLANYPQNLFTLLQQSGQYEATIFEPYTRLAPPEFEERPPVRSILEQVQVSLECLARVYVRICLPENIVSISVPIPRTWFSLPDSFTISRGQHNGILRYGWDRERHIQVAHFLETLTKRAEPHLWFFHVGLPHYPFRYYPSGQAYVQDIPVSFPLPGTRGDLSENWGDDQFAVDQAWQRYLLQVGYADRVLGQILERLESCDMFDQSLLVVTSDHGYSFRANLPQRAPRPETLPDVMPVPLFVKLPGQTSGSTSDRNIETIDILPTIADVIGFAFPQPIDGESAFATTRARLRKTLVAPGGTIGVEAVFPRADESRQRMLTRFGSGRDDRLWTVDVRPEMVGREVDSFPRSSLATRELIFPLQSYRPRLTSEDRVNYFLLEGALEDWEDQNPPVFIAVASAGRIIAVTRTFLEPEYAHCWNALLPEDAVPGGVESLEFWEVLDVAGNVELRACKTHPPK
ncbi:MAG: hypothetical protein B7Z55_05950 [Planctomycetales bacterium 12-60-4]|nr:MAG: hypothetical protein B7Z55_05950 [Planctomycetales bacterium 12-60-4]